MKKTYYLETYGCQMNKNDSELMAVSLKKEGYERVDRIEDAGVVIYNTCSVRKHAEERVLARISVGKKSPGGKERIIAVAGCMAQRSGGELIKNGMAHLVAGPYESPSIGELIEMYRSGRERNTFLSQEAGRFRERILPAGEENLDEFPWHKWVTITHGCENYCSYCIVPHVRGKLISFSSGNIISHIKSLAESGVREITLLGQNVNQYGTDSGDIPFSRLLEKAASVEGLVRINFLTSHPKDFSGDIIRVMRDNGNISRSIHLPLQSGSDKILERMNRNYTMKHYLGIVEIIGRHLDDFSLTTDLIVGFPGEDEDDFRETLQWVDRIGFDDAFMYAYSPRENTPAWDIPEELTREEKIHRLQRLIDLQRNKSREKLAARINRVEKIIVERMSKKSDREVMGKTFLNHPVVVPGSRGDIGMDCLIRIDQVRGNTLQGTRIE